MKPDVLENIDAGDMFEICVDFLDQIENTIELMKTIFNSFEKGNKSLSLTKEGQCRLAALVRFKIIKECLICTVKSLHQAFLG